MVYIVVHKNMARSQVAGGAHCLQIWRVNTIIMNKPSLAADTLKEQSREQFLAVKFHNFKKCYARPRTRKDYLKESQ
jgi:hypothetical protein